MSKEQQDIQFPILIEGYTAVKILGKGGMGEVYLAVDKDGNQVAIKVSRNTPRLKREYAQLQNIQHPRIVKVIDYKEVADYSYLVMEYLDAKTLKDIGRHFKKTIPLAVFSHIFAQVAAALIYIHNPENQQIHRDIKPQNIMILNKADNWGKISVKLMDFGLVKAPDVSQKLTARGTFIGTATYTAPEQFLDASVVDYKADLYALGVTMYEVWTGERLFWGDTEEIRRQHLETRPPLASESRPDTPPALDQLLFSLLEKKSFKRPLSAEAVIAVLSEISGRVFCPHCGAILRSQMDTACLVCDCTLPELWPGKVLQGRYRVEMKIGEGGFGTAYRALDLESMQPCVLKVTAFYREGAAKQFEFEARVLSKLSHPNLPRVYDQFSINENEKCMVMNFAGQINLEQIRQRRRAPVKTVLAIADPLCDVLAFLHSQNPPILHRDIKPANIILSQDGQPMLIDFGIAREYVAGQTTTMSASGMLTPGYSPPEQYYTQLPNISQEKTTSVTQSRQRYRGTDPRSDIYALGATLFALLTGKVPAESIILSGEHKSHPRINQINQYVSDPISDAVYKAMQLPKEDRFASVAEFKEALHDPDFSYQNPKTVAKNAFLARRKKESILRAILAMIVMAAVFVGGVILYPILFPVSTVSAEMLTGLSQTQISNNATSEALRIALLEAENSATLSVLGGMATAMASTSSSNEKTQIALQGFIDETATQAAYQALTEPSSGTKTALALGTGTITPTLTGTSTSTGTPTRMGTLIPTNTPTITRTPSPTIKPSITPSLSTSTRTPTITPSPTTAPIPVTYPDLVIGNVSVVGPTGSCVNMPINYTYNVTVYNQGTGDAGDFVVNALGTMRSISILKAGQSTVLSDIVKQDSTVMADVYNSVQESNESNNLVILYIPYPTAPVTCTPTMTITVTNTPTRTPTRSPTSTPTRTRTVGILPEELTATVAAFLTASAGQ